MQASEWGYNRREVENEREREREEKNEGKGNRYFNKCRLENGGIMGVK